MFALSNNSCNSWQSSQLSTLVKYARATSYMYVLETSYNTICLTSVGLRENGSSPQVHTNTHKLSRYKHKLLKIHNTFSVQHFGDVEVFFSHLEGQVQVVYVIALHHRGRRANKVQRSWLGWAYITPHVDTWTYITLCVYTCISGIPGGYKIL